MRSINLKGLLIPVVISGFFLFAFGCNQNPFIGIGNEVDVTPPKVSVTSHRNGEWVFQDFTITGVVSDNIGVEGVSIRLIERDSLGNETVTNNWAADVNGGTWTKSFQLEADFGNITGQKTLDIAAYDKRRNSASLRILIGITNIESAPVLTKPREIILKKVSDGGGVSYYDASNDDGSTKFDFNDFGNLEYFNNGVVTITGYSKTQYAPDKAITIQLFNSDDLTNDIYHSTITDGVALPAGTSGNTSNFEFNIDTIALNIPNGVYQLVVTVLEATGETREYNKGFILIDQKTDIPKIFITSPGLQTFPNSVAGGTAFDDDGINEIYYIIYKDGLIPGTDYTQWKKFSDDYAIANPSEGTKNLIYGYIDLKSTVPYQYPWIVNPTPSGVGYYNIMAVIVDTKNILGTALPFRYQQFTSSEPPSVTFTQPSDFSITNSGNMSVTVCAKGSSADVKEIQYKISSAVKSTDWQSVTSGWTPSLDSTNMPIEYTVDYTFSVDTTQFTSKTVHDITITTRIINTENIHSHPVDPDNPVAIEGTTINVKADNFEPTVIVANPFANSGLNGVISLSGSVSDDYSGVKSIYIGYFTPALTDSGASAYTEALLDIAVTQAKAVKIDAPPAGWTYLYDTTKIPDNPSYSLYLFAVDIVGNTGYNKVNYTIDQNLDIPVTTVTTPASDAVVFTQSNINGTAKDDDALQYIFYSIRKTAASVPAIPDAVNGWGTVTNGDELTGKIDLSVPNPVEYSWNITSPVNEGDYTIYVSSVDKNGKLQSVNTTRRFFQYSNHNPTIEVVLPLVSVTQKGLVNFDLKANGGANYTVTDIQYQIISTKTGADTSLKTIVPPAFTSANIVNVTIPVNTALYTDASVHDFKIIAYCKNSKNVESVHIESSYKADNIPPTVLVTTPASTTSPAGLNKVVSIGGTASDDYSGVKSLYVSYFTGLDDTDANTYTEATLETALVAGDAIKISNPSAGWSVINYDTEKISATETDAAHTLYVFAVDAMGNTGWGKISHNINQILDIPGSDIAIPVESQQVLPQSVISATATDDDGVKVVYYAIQKTSAGVPVWSDLDSTSDGIIDGWGTVTNPDKIAGIITVSGSPKVYTLPELKTPTAEGTYTIYLRTLDIGNKLQTTIFTREFSQYSSALPTAQITNTNTTTILKGFIDVDIKATGGGTNTVTEIQYEVEDGIWESLTAPGDFASGLTEVNKTIQINSATYSTITKHDLKIRVKAKNDIGGWSNTEAIYTYFTVDNEVPTAEITSPVMKAATFFSPLPDPDNVDNLQYYKNNTFKLKGVISDDLKAKSVSISLLEDGVGAPIVLATDMLTTSSWSLDVDTTILTDDKRFLIRITSKDAAGNESVSTDDWNFYVDQDMDKPRATITAPLAASTTIPGSQVGGTVIDDDGVAQVFYSIRKTVGTPTWTNDTAGWGTVNTADEKAGVLTASGSQSFTIANLTTPSGEGEYRIYMRIKDTTGVFSDSADDLRVTFKHDQYGPTIVTPLTTPAPVAGVYYLGAGATFTVAGSVTDNISNISKVELKVDNVLEATMTDVGSGLTGAGTTSATWTKTLTIASLINVGSRNYTDKTIEVIAYDAQNNTSTKTFTLKGDTTAPTIVAPLTTPAPVAGVYYLGTGATFTVAGTVTDDISIVKVELKVDNVLEATMTDVGSGLTGAGTTSATWTKTLTIASLINVGSRNYADKAIDVIAYDAQNNASTKTFTLKGDTNLPIIVIPLTTPAPVAGVYYLGTGATFTVAGTVTDDISIVKVELKVDNVLEATMIDVGSGLTGAGTTSATWTKTLTIASLTNAGSRNYSDKAIDVIAYDSQNNTSTKTFTLKGDTTAPTIVTPLTTPAQVAGVYYLGTGATFTVAGTVTDEVSIVSKVELKVDNVLEATMIDVGSGLGAGTTSRTWTKTLTIASLTNAGSRNYADKTIEVIAYDAENNASTKTFTLKGDTTVPVIVTPLTTPAPVAGVYYLGTGATFTVAGTVTDEVSIVSKVELKVDNVLEATMTDVGSGLGAGTTSRAWTKTLTIASLINAGSRNYADKTIEVIAYDAENNASTKTFTLKGDTTAPTIVTPLTTPAPVTEVYYLGTGATFTVAGTVTDDVSIVKVELKVDNVLEATMIDVGSGLTGVGTTSATWTKTLTIASLINVGSRNYADKAIDVIAYDAQNNASTKTFTLKGDMTAPTIVTPLTTPAPVAGVYYLGTGATFTVAGTVTDEVSIVSKVELKVDNVLEATMIDVGSGLGAGTTSRTWTKTLTIASLTNVGSRNYADKTIELIAYDAQNNASTKTFTLKGDTTAPTIVTPLTTPAPVAGVYYLGTGATFTVAGTVTDEVSIVSKVELKVDNVLEATMIDVGSGLGAGTTSRTWTKTLTIASLINVGSRNYSDKAIDVIAYDAQNNASTKTFTLKGDKVAPSVVSTTPAEGGSIGDNATFDLSVRASDDTEIDKITITFDGVGTTWDSSNGAHLFTLEPGSTTIDKTWTRTFDIAGELGGYSNKGVTITAFDKYNNSIVTRRNFTGDIAKPDTITITNANNSALPASFNLEGTFGDNIAVTRILIELDGGSTWDTADALQDGITFTTAKTGNWSKALTVAGDLGNTYTDKMFTVTAFDAQGNSRPATVTLIGDRRAPVIADLLPASGSFQKTSGGSFTLSGTVSDKRQDNVTNGVVSSVSITYSGTTKSATSFDGTNWSISSTEFTVVEGNASFDVVATDNLGNSSTERIFVIVDNSVPAVGYISPSAGSVLNGVTPISGTVSDGSSGVKSIYIAYLTSVPTLTNYDTEAELEAKASTVIGDITDGGAKHLFKIASPTASWSHDFDTTKLYDQYNAVENAAVIYVFAVDMMGNVRTTGNTLSIKIDQREDIPTGQIFSPAAAVVSPQTVVSGMVSDDDGVAKIYWYIGDATVTPPVNVTTWAAENAINTKTKAGTIDLTATNPRDASFTLTSPNEIGNFKTWIVVEDIDGKRSYFPDADFSAAYDNNLIKTFTQEVSTTPTVTNLTAPVATLSGIENVSISVLGGTTDTSLELDITSIKYTIVSSFKNSGELSVVVAPGSKTWTGDVTFDTTEYTDVNDYYDITVTIWATNSQGNTSQNSVVIYKADNKGPTVQITGPVNGEIINGNQIIFGTANDWAQVDALYFGYFTTASEPDMVAAYDTKAEFEANLVADVSAAATPINKWFKVANPSLNWNYTFNTTKVYDDLAGHTNYKLFVAAVDMVGNVSYDFETYTIDQDKDKPIVTITNPSLNGITDPVAEYTSIVKIPKTYVMMGTVKDGDGEGVRNVEIDIDLMNPDGSKNSDIYPLNTIGDSGDGYNNVSSSEPMILGDQVTNWTYQMEDYIINGAGGFYKVTVRPVDYGTPPVKGLIATSYFVVSNEAPELTIISPSIYDPDGSPATNVDMYGTVISNVKDDIYWDNDNSNNLIYHDDDSNRRNWGWNNDLSEAIFNIFGSNAVDSTRSNYYRMIFRAKDNGRLNNIEVSVDGGQNAAAEITWSGGKASAIGTFSSVLNSAAIVKVGVMNDGATAAYTNFTYNDMSTATDIQTDWVYFFVDIDTTQLSSSTILRITAADNNEPSSYETTASVGINVDNSTPSGNIKNWGIDSLDENYDFGKTSNHQFIGGDLADVGSAGVRYVNLYFWNNQASSPDDTPDYNEDGAGLLIVNDLANVPSGTHKITMPEDLGSVTSSSGDVLPANTNNNLPNYWIRTHKYLSSGWRIQEIYTNNANPTDADGQPGTYYGVSTKYGSTEPTDGKKLICLEIVDNAGNKLRKFYEHTFSEYPPSHENTYLSWAAMNHAADKQTVTDETTAGRKWISGDLVMSGTVRDFTAVTNPSPGIERVRVYVKSENGTTTHAIYTSKTADTVADAAHNNVVPAKVINTIADISVSPTATDTSVAWEFASGQATTGRTDGNYLIEVEVRDKTGVTSVKKQYVYIDNTAPSLTVTQPTAAQVVKGDLFTFTGTVVTTGETFEGNCISISVTYPGGSNSWTTGVTGSAWSKAWDLGAETEFTQGESATVSISVTDKAGNTTTNPDITISKGAPPTWTNFTANASSTAFTNAAFIANYSSVITVNEVYMIKGATSTFVAEIDDGVTFTDADLVITGLKQSDGTTHSETTRSMTINTTEVTDSFGYSSIPDGEYTYKAELKQGTAEINMKKYFIVDNTKPNIWVKKIENTDYVLDGATKLGHIDAEHGDWGTGYTTTADAISGVVKTRVKVKDNYLLKNVSVSLENYNFGNGDGTAKVLLERDITGAWGTAASRGVVGDLNYFAVKDVAISLGADSDYVSFTLEFNTANLTGVAGINKSLQFTATDWVGNLTDEAGTNAGIETATYDTYNSATVMGVGNAKPVAFVLDVVPYITRIDTQLGNATSVVDRKSVYNRTSTGRYPVYKDLTRGLYEVINVYGYNLVPDYIVVGKDADGINATNNGLEAGVNQLGGITTVVANSQYSVSVENAVQSGYINVVNATGWISTTNNVKSVYSTENEEKNNMNNNLLKDNRWLELWTFNQVAGVTEARMVDMELSTNNNINWGMGYTDNRAGVSVNNAAPVELRRSYTRYFDNKIAFNTSNSYFFVSQCGDTLGVPVTAWTSGPSQFGLNYRNTPGASWEYNSAAAGGRKVYIESNWNGADVNKLDRVQNPDMKISGDDAYSRVYMTYYDSLQKLVKFRFFEIGTDAAITTGGTVNVDYVTLDTTGTIRSTLVPYRNGGVQWNQTEQGVVGAHRNGGTKRQGFVAIAGANGNSNTAAVGYTADNTAIVAWYDSVGTSLKIKYNTSPWSSYSGYFEFDSNNLAVPVANTYRFKLSVDGTLVNSGNDIAVTFTAPTGGTNRHQLVYELNKILTENYGCFAEVNPVTNRLIFRSFQTGATSRVVLSAPTGANSLLTAMGAFNQAAGAGVAWVERSIDTDGAGKFVSITTDGGAKGGIHLAYQQTANGDLKYAYLPTYDCADGAIRVVTVDSYGQVGQYTDINIKDVSGAKIPYITYYNMSNADTKLGAKVAYPITAPSTWTDNTVAGVNSSELFTGNWEVSIIPAREVPKQYRISNGITTAGDLIVGYQGDLVEYGTYLP